MSSRTKRPTFVVMDEFGDPVFNSDNQSCVFPSLSSAYRGIKEDLDEPESEDDDGNICSKRTDGVSEKDYVIYKRYTP